MIEGKQWKITSHMNTPPSSFLKKATRPIKLVQYGVALVLIYILSNYLEWDRVVQTLGSLRLYWMLSGLGTFLLGHILYCLRIDLCILNKRMDLRALFLSYLTSLPIGMILPTEMGADLVRIKDASSFMGSKARATAAIAFSRIAGFLAILFLFSLVGALNYSRISSTGLVWAWIVGMFGLVSLIIILINRTIKNTVVKIMSKKIWPNFLAHQISGALDHLGGITTERKTLFRILILALATQTIAIVTNYCYTLALGIQASFLDIAFFIPVISASAVIPLSPGGVGVKEGIIMILFQTAGLPPEDGLALALVNRMAVVSLALIGTALFPLRHKIGALSPSGEQSGEWSKL